MRIGKLPDDRASDLRFLTLLSGGFERPPLEPAKIHVSSTMKALLTGATDEFRIDLKSPEEQIIDAGAPTEWRWLVEPLVSGKHRLHLSAIAIVKVEGAEKQKELSVYDTDITVKINVPHYVSEHWKEISDAVSGTGVAGWIVARFRKRKTHARKRLPKQKAASAG